MERLSPRANGCEYVKGRELATADLGEAIPQQAFDAAKVVLRQAHGLDDARRFGAAVGFRVRLDHVSGRTRDQLYNEAKHKGIKGRSKMNKAQLERAVGR